MNMGNIAAKIVRQRICSNAEIIASVLGSTFGEVTADILLCAKIYGQRKTQILRIQLPLEEVRFGVFLAQSLAVAHVCKQFIHAIYLCSHNLRPNSNSSVETFSNRMYDIRLNILPLLNLPPVAPPFILSLCQLFERTQHVQLVKGLSPFSSPNNITNLNF